MSLVADYSDSSSEEDEILEKKKTSGMKLPSVDDMFASVDTKISDMSFGATPHVEIKKRVLEGEVQEKKTGVVKRKTRSLVPPQLKQKRANVSTEDLRYVHIHLEIIFEIDLER